MPSPPPKIILKYATIYAQLIGFPLDDKNLVLQFNRNKQKKNENFSIIYKYARFLRYSA